MSQAIEADLRGAKKFSIEENDPASQYLIDGIKHACGISN